MEDWNLIMIMIVLVLFGALIEFHFDFGSAALLSFFLPSTSFFFFSFFNLDIEVDARCGVCGDIFPIFGLLFGW